MNRIDLSTRYLGIGLKHPIVASASPLTGSIESLKRLEDGGVAAVVLPSLFEEQIEHEEMATHNLMLYGSELSPEASGFFPEQPQYTTGPDRYLTLIADAKQALAVPVIASLNGYTPGGWTSIAKQCEQAGADAIELNVYFLATNLDDSSAAVEARYIDLVKSVVGQVKIPVAVKVAPYFSAMANMASRLAGAGASGLVLFNRFLQPDIELEELQVAPHLVLSTSDELRLALRWPCSDRWCPYGGRRAQAASGRRRLRDAREQPAEERPGARWRAGPRRRGVADGARLRFGRADEGFAEPAGLSRPGCLRARQLHEGTQVVHERIRVKAHPDGQFALRVNRRSTGCPIPPGGFNGPVDQRRLHGMRRLQAGLPERSDQ
jgi:dihydroorotate dehydrogenase